MKHRGEKWTTEEIELTKKLYTNGMKIDDIILKVNHSHSAIEHKLNKLGLTNRRILWTKEDDDKLKELFEQGLGYSKIAEILGKTTRACQGRAIRNGLKKKECNVWKDNPRADFWKDEEINKMKELIELGASRKEISSALGRSEGSINNKMCELRLFLKSKSLKGESDYRRVYSVDDSFFENIDSQKKAYWLGWMITDGYVISELHTKRGIINSTKVGLKISVKDLDVIDEITQDTKSTFPIKHIIVRVNQKPYVNKITGESRIITGGAHCCYEVSSAKMVEDLLKYGVVQNKTYNVRYPDLLEERFAPGFIAGVISGDGSVSIKNNHNKAELLRCNIAGNLDLLKPIKEILVKTIDYNSDKKIYKYRSTKNLYNLELNQTETIALYYWLKDNGVSLMKRKDEIIKNYIEKEKESL